MRAYNPAETSRINHPKTTNEINYLKKLKKDVNLNLQAKFGTKKAPDKQFRLREKMVF